MTKGSTDGVWVKVADASDIKEDEIMALQVGQHSVAIYRLPNNEFYATHNICTHEVACLSEGWLDGHLVECPLHGGKFDIRTGEGQGAPITEPVATYPVKLVDGALMLDVSTLRCS